MRFLFQNRPKPLSRHIFTIIGILGITAFLGINPAAAYVLKGPHILDLMVKQFGKADRLRVSQKLILKDNSTEQSPIEFEEIVRYTFPDSFRSDTFSDSTKRVHVSSQGDAITIMDRKISSEPESEYDLYKDLLLYHSRILLQNRLTLLGVDIGLSSVGRFQNKIAYIIGAEYPDETRSQVWIDKESFRPIRWLLIKSGPTDNGTVMEFRYGMWQQIDSLPYPMQIQIFQDGFLIREIIADSLTFNPPFEAALFDIEYLKTQYEADLSEEIKIDDIGEVQKTIQEFKKRYQ
jgi:hypothetical protein